MAYTEEYRKITIEYRMEGHTLRETSEIFKVSESTIRNNYNYAFHRKNELISIANKYDQEYKIIFLPPYSPEFNPIEKFWAWLKAQLRKILPKYESFDLALADCF